MGNKSSPAIKAKVLPVIKTKPEAKVPLAKSVSQQPLPSMKEDKLEQGLAFVCTKKSLTSMKRVKPENVKVLSKIVCDQDCPDDLNDSEELLTDNAEDPNGVKNLGTLCRSLGFDMLKDVINSGINRSIGRSAGSALCLWEHIVRRDHTKRVKGRNEQIGCRR